MNCDEWRHFLQDYVDGTLSGNARNAIDAHLSDCADCFNEARTHKRIDGELAALPQLDPPEGLVDRVMARLESAGGNWKRELLRIAAAAVIVAGLGYAFYDGYRDSFSPDRFGTIPASVEAGLDVPKEKFNELIQKAGLQR